MIFLPPPYKTLSLLSTRQRQHVVVRFWFERRGVAPCVFAPPVRRPLQGRGIGNSGFRGVSPARAGSTPGYTPASLQDAQRNCRFGTLGTLQFSDPNRTAVCHTRWALAERLVPDPRSHGQSASALRKRIRLDRKSRWLPRHRPSDSRRDQITVHCRAVPLSWCLGTV
jgi:hypothetical protein